MTRTASASFVVLAGAFLSGVLPIAVVSAQEVTTQPAEFASVDWPASGERLRELAERHDIEVGFAARSDWPNQPGAEFYGPLAAAEYGMLTPESAFKWEFLRPSQGEFDFAELDALSEFAETNGMVLHGHPLVWYLLNPPWAETLPAAEMPAVLEEHVRTVVSRYRGRYAVWDVVNEALNDDGTDIRDDFWTRGFGGTSYMDLAFRTAREADPDATLLYNEYDISWLSEKSARALALVDDLLARDVPIDGIGMQMHLENPFDRFEGMSEAMQRFADRGLDIYITELDVAIMQDTELGEQSAIYEETIRRCLMQPACRAVQVWGVNDFYSWRPWFDPLPFDDDFRVKPAYFGMQRALMSRPLHPERCELEGARVVSGAVYADQRDDGAGVDGAGDAFSLQCDAVRLEGGFETLAIRYRNPGTDSPQLDIRSNGEVIASAVLVPTSPSANGDFRTLDVSLPVINATQDLQIDVASNSAGADVGIDALLFSAPRLALPDASSFAPEDVDGVTDSPVELMPDAATGDGENPGESSESGGSDVSGEPADSGESSGPAAGTDGDGEPLVSSTDEGSSSGFLGAAGPLSLLLLALVALAIRAVRAVRAVGAVRAIRATRATRQRQSRVLAGRPASSRTGVGTR